MRSTVIIVFPPTLAFSACICKVQEPMCIETFSPELTIQAFNVSIVTSYLILCLQPICKTRIFSRQAVQIMGSRSMSFSAFQLFIALNFYFVILFKSRDLKPFNNDGRGHSARRAHCHEAITTACTVQIIKYSPNEN